jgi:hypothetical protein
MVDRTKLIEAAKEIVAGCCAPDGRTGGELVDTILAEIEAQGYVIVRKDLHEATGDLLAAIADGNSLTDRAIDQAYTRCHQLWADADAAPAMIEAEKAG